MEDIAAKYLQYGIGSLTEEEVQAITGSDKSPIAILQQYLGTPDEFNRRTLVNEYYASKYASLLAEYDVALSGVATDPSTGAWNVIEEIVDEMARHPHVLKQTPGLSFDSNTKTWVKDDVFFRTVEQNKGLYLQKADLLISKS